MYLQGKKIAVLGVGREGVALAEYFKLHNIKADFFDENLESDTSEIEKLGFAVTSKIDAFDNLDNYDIVFRSPGISPNHPKLKSITGRLTSLTELFICLWPGKTVGVTGTKGKGTTASIIKSILDEASKDAVLVGNIGHVNLVEIDQHNNKSFAVMELSSFQLMGLGASPDIAVALDISIEHLDYHKTINEYHNAKLEISRHQQPEDWLVVTAKNPLLGKFKNTSKSNIIEVFGESTLTPTGNSVWWKNGSLCTNVKRQDVCIDLTNIKLVGEHNKINIAAATAVGIIVGIKSDTIKKAIEEFQPLSQRLENIGIFGGVKFINDSASTNPPATEAAIDAFSEPEIVILGGKNKGLDYEDLVDKIASKSNVKKLIVFGALSDEIEVVCGRINFDNIIIVETLEDAIRETKEIAMRGDVVIFSPGAASFDQFKNYNVRGQKFNKLVYEYFNK